MQGLHVTPDRMFQQVMTLHDTLAQAPHSMLAVAFIGRDFWRAAAVGSWPTEPAHGRRPDQYRIHETVGLAPVVPRFAAHACCLTVLPDRAA
jgi:hypothetical protein